MMKRGLMGLVLHVYRGGSCPIRVICRVLKNSATGGSTGFSLSAPENEP